MNFESAVFWETESKLLSSFDVRRAMHFKRAFKSTFLFLWKAHKKKCCHKNYLIWLQNAISNINLYYNDLKCCAGNVYDYISTAVNIYITIPCTISVMAILYVMKHRNRTRNIISVLIVRIIFFQYLLT